MISRFVLGFLAAGFAQTVLAQEAAKPETGRSEPEKRIVEVMFVLDTTGSMAGLIDGAKRKIWSIATAIIDENPNADVRMGLVAYRDIGDEYVTKAFPITKDIQDLYAELLALKARGGGDWPESVNEALDEGVSKTAWTTSPAADRILFLVGDAPPHMSYAQDRKYPEVIAVARQKGIIVNAVQAGNAQDTERAWRTIAQLGQGRYIPIPQDGGKVVVIETPFDREIIELQIELNRTIVPYGSLRQQSSVEKRANTVKAAPSASAASDMAGYVNRSSKGMEAVTGEGDLVADIAAGRRKLSEIPAADLPESFKGLDAEAQAARIEENTRRRGALASQMSELVRKRDGYLAQARPKGAGKSDAFDDAVKATLRAQMKR